MTRIRFQGMTGHPLTIHRVTAPLSHKDPTASDGLTISGHDATVMTWLRGGRVGERPPRQPPRKAKIKPASPHE